MYCVLDQKVSEGPSSHWVALEINQRGYPTIVLSSLCVQPFLYCFIIRYLRRGLVYLKLFEKHALNMWICYEVEKRFRPIYIVL